jgi:hypothetical protein
MDAGTDAPRAHREKTRHDLDRAERRSSCCLFHIWPPASRRDRHRDVLYLWLSRSALPCITHENNSTTLQQVNRPLTILIGARTFFPSDILGHPARLPVPIFPMRRVRSEDWSREIIAGARED